MRAKPVAALPVDPDSAKRYSRPHVSNDNPYPDSQFKTMTYRPDAPARLGCNKDAGARCRTLFAWHNTRHRYAGTGDMTPHSVHFGHAQAVREARAATLDAALLALSDRFKKRRPQPHPLPTTAWINPPPTQNFRPDAAQPCTADS